MQDLKLEDGPIVIVFVIPTYRAHEFKFSGFSKPVKESLSEFNAIEDRILFRTLTLEFKSYLTRWTCFLTPYWANSDDVDLTDFLIWSVSTQIDEL